MSLPSDLSQRLAERVSHFSESVIRGTTRHAMRFNAINLAQGMPDFDAPEEVKEAAIKAIRDGFNQYAITWGAPVLRQAIAEKAKSFNGITADPDANITVCCGSTEAMMATVLAVINPDDEVIIFQPFYENYGPDAKLSQAKPVYVNLHWPDWRLDEAELAAAFTPRTRAIIVNTPHNPTGKVFNRRELELIAELAIKHNVLVITDEIYEHIQYTDEKHLSIASLPGMAERTVTISGLSKTFSMTGWRLGYAIAPATITTGIRRVHDFLTVGAPHPLQIAAATAMKLPETYYAKLQSGYRNRREILCGYLRQAGFEVRPPDGAYYVIVDITGYGKADDTTFVRDMIEQIGVAAVPGSSFYAPQSLGHQKVRFMFAKRDETLHAAGEKLVKLAAWRTAGV